MRDARSVLLLKLNSSSSCYCSAMSVSALTESKGRFSRAALLTPHSPCNHSQPA
jgi:hypothetical protein